MMEATRPLRLVAAATLIILGSFAPGPIAADAAPLFAVELDFGDIDETSSEPFSRSFESSDPIVAGNFRTLSAFGSAERGALRASAAGNIFYPDMREVGTGTVLNSTDAIVAFRLDDVVITGPTPSVITALNLHLSGGAGANAFARNLDGVGNEALADASVRIFGTVNGVFFEGIQARSAVWNVGTGLGGGSSFESGLLAGFDGDAELESEILDLPVGVPLVVILGLGVSAGTTVRSSGFGALPVERKAEAAASFASTLSFPISGPVFDLPPGYTVHSPSGLIVDNQWVGGERVTDVPEPSSLLLLAAGIAGLLTVTRRWLEPR